MARPAHYGTGFAAHRGAPPVDRPARPRWPRTRCRRATPADSGFAEAERAEHGRRDRAERQEHRHLGRRRVAQRPQPEVVARAAADADERHREPAACRELRRRGEESLGTGPRREERHRRQHGERAHGERRVAPHVRAIEHAAERPTHGARQHRDLADPRVLPRRRGRRARTQRHADPGDGEQDASKLLRGEGLVPEGRGDDQGEEGKGREDERRRGRRARSAGRSSGAR